MHETIHDRICPNTFLHSPAIDAGPTRKIDQQRFVLFSRFRQCLLIIFQWFEPFFAIDRITIYTITKRRRKTTDQPEVSVFRIGKTRDKINGHSKKCEKKYY